MKTIIRKKQKQTITKIIFSKETTQENKIKAISFLEHEVNGQLYCENNNVIVWTYDSSCLKALINLKLSVIPEIEFISKRTCEEIGIFCCELKTVSEDPFIELKRFKPYSDEAFEVDDWVNDRKNLENEDY